MAQSLEDLTVDQLLAHARQLQAQANTLTALSSNPQTREGLQELLKTANPNLVIPELDAKKAIRAEFKTLQDDHAKLRQEILERDIKDRLERQRAGIRDKYQLTDADILAVEQLMTDKDNPIPTYDAAARVHVASRQSAVPTSASFAPPTYSMPEKEIWGKGIGNPAALDRAALNEAYSVWNELMTGKVPKLGAARAA